MKIVKENFSWIKINNKQHTRLNSYLKVLGKLRRKWLWFNMNGNSIGMDRKSKIDEIKWIILEGEYNQLQQDSLNKLEYWFNDTFKK